MTQTPNHIGDITRQSWIERQTPPAFGPYIRLARLDRPVGIWLLVFPCWWSILLTHPTIPDALYYGTLFLVGAVLMRSAGCVINDLLDRDLDGRVARTQTRPLPAGEITPKQALLFLIMLLSCSFIILLQFNMITICLGVGAFGLVCLYPLMKRWTWWPQAFLGLTFNWGALMGWAALDGRISVASVMLYVGGVFWTLAYDTIYAHQDREDDALVGIKSTARRLGAHSKIWVGGFSLLAGVFWAIAGWMASTGIIWQAGVMLATVFMLAQTRNWQVNAPQNCLQQFRAHRFVGWILLAGGVAAAVIS